MRNKKTLLALALLSAAVGISAFALSGCSDNGKGNDPSTDITDPNVPLDPGGCKHTDVRHVSAKAAGCETGGNKEYWFCDDCDKYFSDEELTVETSLAGITLGAAGHNYGELIAESSATCEKTGIIAHYHCSVCNSDFDADKKHVTDLVIPVASHTYGEWINGEPATCTENGVKAHKDCTVCEKHFDADNNIITDLVIPVVSHTYGEWINEDPATCTENGVKAHKDCTVCNKHFDADNNVITDLVIVAGHAYGDLIAEVPAAGCTAGVKAHYHCDACNTDFDENKVEFNGLPFPIGNGLITIPAPHNIKDYPAEEASCIVDGHGAYRQCEDCEEYFDEFGNISFEEPVFVSGTHSYGEFIYDYTTKSYVKTCKHDSTHTVEQAAGTEEYPHIISSEAEWAGFAAEHDEKSITVDKADVYYKVTSNLDFSDTTERVDVFHFSGTIDFGGHTVKGITPENTVYKYGTGLTTGLFVLTHDATIKNLNFELSYFGSANALALPVIIAWRGDVVLDNVTVSGNATHASNNGTAFVYFVWATAYNSTLVNPEAGNKDYVKVPSAPIKLTFNNCTNYANITNTGADATSGYVAAFLGQVVANTEGNIVELKGCVNEGTLTGYHFASMLIANPASADKINTLTVENCVNNGKIYSGIANGAWLVIGNNSSGKYTEFNNVNSGEGKVVNGANGVTTNISIKALEIGKDGNFVINAVEGATVYKMVFVFSVEDVNLDENGKPIHWGTTNVTIDVDVNSEVKALEFVDYLDVNECEKNEFGLYVTADGANYVLRDDEYPSLKMKAQPTIYLTAYNAEGEVVGVSTCYLADALKAIA